MLDSHVHACSNTAGAAETSLARTISATGSDANDLPLSALETFLKTVFGYEKRRGPQHPGCRMIHPDSYFALAVQGVVMVSSFPFPSFFSIGCAVPIGILRLFCIALSC